jgi:hypothetical protein
VEGIEAAISMLVSDGYHAVFVRILLVSKPFHRESGFVRRQPDFLFSDN